MRTLRPNADDTIVTTTVATVVLSVLAHGLSAKPLAAAFGARATE